MQTMDCETETHGTQVGCISIMLIIHAVHLQPYMNCKDYNHKLKYNISFLYFVNFIL